MDNTRPLPLSFLALGDSYTIGEAVAEEGRWPVQLAQEMGVARLQPPKIIAKTGWTTDELQAAIDAEAESGGLQQPYGLVSLLIGVNNQYRGYDTTQYLQEFEALLDQAIAFAGARPGRVFVVSIPDYGVTPFASSKDPEKIARELDWYNAAAGEIASSKGVVMVDITPISREAAKDSSLIASDGLHPSAKMYKLWVEKILPVVEALRAK